MSALPFRSRLARTVATLALLAVMTAALPASAAAQTVAPPTREEIQRDQLDQQLRTQGQPITVDNTLERAPCPLAEPQFQGLTFTLSEARFSGLNNLPAEIVAPAYRDLVGQTIPVGRICEIRDRAAQILRDAGYLATVQVPVQEIAGGVVRFDVIAARMTSAQVRGEAGASGAMLQRYIDKLIAQPVFNTRDAERYLLLARDIPGLDVRLVLQPAAKGGNAQPGDVVGVFNVRRTPVYADLTVQNFSAKATGRFGALARMRVNGLTGLGDQTTLSVYSAETPKEQVILQAGHEMRLGGEGFVLAANAAWAWSKPDLGGTSPFDTRTFIGTVQGTYPFVRRETANLSGTLGFDLIDQDIDFSGAALSKDSLRVGFVRFDYNTFDRASLRGGNGYSAFEPRFAFGASLELRQGLAILGASDDCGPAFARCALPGVVPLSRLDGDPTAFVVRGQARLDFRPTPKWTLTLAPRFQYSPDPLLSYEQISGGNYTAGRGFDPGSVIGDSGFGGQVELAYGSLLPEQPGGHAVQPYAFFDLMAVDTNNVAGPLQTITSAGGGVRATLAERVYLDLFGAVPLDRGPFQTSVGQARVLLTLTVQLAPWHRQ